MAKFGLYNQDSEKPLQEYEGQWLFARDVFADLRNGRTYNVLTISKVKEPSPFKYVPKEVMQTSDAKPLAEEELATLRNVHKADEDPDWPYLILP